MDRIFWGMAFILLDLDVNIGERTLGVIPDWLGYWWLFRGFWELEEQWGGFRKWRRPAMVLAAYSAVVYVMHALVLSVRQEFLLWALGLVTAAAGVVMIWLVGRGIGHMEAQYGWDLRGGKLGSLWLYLAVMLVLDGLLGWMPLVGTVCAVAETVLALFWLAVLWDSRKRYIRSAE